MLGLTGGHALHGEMTLDQLFVFRLVLHYSDYRTPVGGLYLCGAGTYPGGGVTGANGRNCAAAVIADRRRRPGDGSRHDTVQFEGRPVPDIAAPMPGPVSQAQRARERRSCTGAPANTLRRS